MIPYTGEASLTLRGLPRRVSLRTNKQADNLAQKQGFFVISATGDVVIQNKEDFKPKIFS